MEVDDKSEVSLRQDKVFLEAADSVTLDTCGPADSAVKRGTVRC